MRNGKALLGVVAGVAAAAWLVWGGTGRNPEARDVRVVQAPALIAANAAAPDAGAAHEGPAPAGSKGPKRDRAGAAQGEPAAGQMVGFTRVDGRLYLVTARTAAWAARARDIDGTPAFSCGAGKADGFQAWALRNSGGNGSLPDLSRDGELLTAPRDGEPLSCRLQARPRTGPTDPTQQEIR